MCFIVNRKKKHCSVNTVAIKCQINFSNDNISYTVRCVVIFFLNAFIVYTPINCYNTAITFCVNHIPAHVRFMDVLQLITAHPLEKPGNRRGNGRGKIFVIAGEKRRSITNSRICGLSVMNRELRGACSRR